VLEAFQARQGHLGEKNVGVALKLLESLAIPVVSRDVGGRSGRKLIFHTDLGNAWVAKL
jgi:chemotaxis receptor (MCP) glutamine deamidase CheD